jgi:hypothetical protein
MVGKSLQKYMVGNEQQVNMGEQKRLVSLDQIHKMLFIGESINTL